MTTSTGPGARQQAIFQLLRTGLLDIRGSAQTGRKLSEGGVTDPGGTDEHISMIADVLKDLVPGAFTEADAIDSLNGVWRSRSEQQRLWMGATLARHGVDWQAVIDVEFNR